MLTIEEAQRLVLEHAQALPACEVTLEAALDRVLAQEVYCDLDSPPYDKSIVDGYAVRLADLTDGNGELTILEEITAGAVPSRHVVAGTATRLMTGAPVPTGADAVVMIERTQVSATGAGALGNVVIHDAGVSAQRTNVLRQGAAMRRGELVLSPGALLGPANMGLLAELGRAQVRVVRQPRVAILATGDELTAVDQTPGPGQIRNSNGPMLAAFVRRSGCAAVDLGVARDRPEALREKIRLGLECDMLVLSGGVSAGVHDLAPQALADEGVRQVFHKIRLKPGKPLWFGVRDMADAPRLVFGLPGNPVSSFVCFEMFAKPALARLQGRLDARPRPLRVTLTAPFRHRGDRPTCHPSRLVPDENGLTWQAEPLRWAGSADLRGLAAANGLVQFPAGDHDYAVGDALTAFLV